MTKKAIPFVIVLNILILASCITSPNLIKEPKSSLYVPISAEEAKGINRTTVAEIYKLIVADLQMAATNGINTKYPQMVLSSPNNIGRANSWSAKALLAKVFLTQWAKP